MEALRDRQLDAAGQRAVAGEDPAAPTGAALERLANVLGRVQSSWRPASAEEGFEIVRRRLFDELPADLAAQHEHYRLGTPKR